MNAAVRHMVSRVCPRRKSPLLGEIDHTGQTLQRRMVSVSAFCEFINNWLKAVASPRKRGPIPIERSIFDMTIDRCYIKTC